MRQQWDRWPAARVGRGLTLLLVLVIVRGAPITVASPARTAAVDRTATPSPDAEEVAVTFRSGADAIDGSLLLPRAARGQKLPAAVILSGSGSVDRDGNTPILPGPINTNLNFARALARDGLASLRYDKLGTGTTGMASLRDPAQIGFTTYVDGARAAYAYLRSRPEIDPTRVMILGHSEGTLIALVVAGMAIEDGVEPRALVLAAPLGLPYLEMIRRQVIDQYTQALKAGQVTREQLTAVTGEIDRINRSLTESGHLPATIESPELRPLFNPANERFLAEVARYDPRQLAAALPPSLPVLILHGSKDQQVSAADTQAILDGFRNGGAQDVTLVELPGVNHVFKEVPGTPNPVKDYPDPDLPFSREAAARLRDFVDTHLSRAVRPEHSPLATPRETTVTS